jgi:hypothetical protein
VDAIEHCDRAGRLVCSSGALCTRADVEHKLVEPEERDMHVRKSGCFSGMGGERQA